MISMAYRIKKTVNDFLFFRGLERSNMQMLHWQRFSKRTYSYSCYNAFSYKMILIIFSFVTKVDEA